MRKEAKKYCIIGPTLQPTRADPGYRPRQFNFRVLVLNQQEYILMDQWWFGRDFHRQRCTLVRFMDNLYNVHLKVSRITISLVINANIIITSDACLQSSKTKVFLFAWSFNLNNKIQTVSTESVFFPNTLYLQPIRKSCQLCLPKEILNPIISHC